MQVQGSRRLPVEMVQALYRVVQEALANVARHAGADRVWVDIEYLPDQMSVRIRDFGRGFDVEHAGGVGMGLSSMKERMADLGGDFRVQSQPGQGALILATAPSGRLRKLPAPVAG